MDLAALVASVPNQADVFQSDKTAAEPKDPVVPPDPVVKVKTSDEVGLDGAAWHVYNTLRSGDDKSLLAQNGLTATFDDVRAIVAANLGVV